VRKILLLLLLLNFACKNQIVSPERADTGNQIPILAWYSIPPSETSILRYEELKETGITHNLSFFPDTETMLKALDIANEAGIKMIAHCPELKTNTEKTVRQIMNHPALAGYMLRDEPNRTDFADLGKWAKEIQSVDPDHFCYLNLFPNYASEEQLGTKTYKEHVDLFIEEVPLKVISFDHYPVLGDSLRANWYENLEIISEAARNAGKPFWAFALSVAHGPYPIPTLAQLKLQMYSNLAYGAQGIQYFTYWTPYDTTWNFNNAPINIDGKKTIVYDRIKEVNMEIKNLSGIFVDSKVISVTHTGSNIPSGTLHLEKLPPPFKKLETDGIGAVVSVLKNGEVSYLVLVNRDFKNPMSLILECDPKVKKVSKDGSVTPANTYQNQSEIDPGDIAIYMWTD
jgi:Beta-galactosidase